MTNPKKYKNGSEHAVVDSKGNAVAQYSGGVFESHADGSMTLVEAPTGDPPCECQDGDETLPTKFYNSLEEKQADQQAVTKHAKKSTGKTETALTPSVAAPTQNRSA